MRGVFGAAAGGASCPATCDLMVLNSQRSLNYIDQIVKVAEKTLKTGYRDLTPAAEYIEKYALLPECPNSLSAKNVILKLSFPKCKRGLRSRGKSAPRHPFHLTASRASCTPHVHVNFGRTR